MKSRLQSTILIAMILAVMALLIAAPDSVYAGSAPTVTYDSYERVIIKHNHDFKIDYTIPGTDTECSLRSMENKVVISDVDLTAFFMDTVIVVLKIRHRSLFPLEILGRIDQFFNR